jgi:hypothetical protein
MPGRLEARMKSAAIAVVVIRAMYIDPRVRWGRAPFLLRKICHVPTKNAGTTVATWI